MIRPRPAPLPWSEFPGLAYRWIQCHARGHDPKGFYPPVAGWQQGRPYCATCASFITSGPVSGPVRDGFSAAEVAGLLGSLIAQASHDAAVLRPEPAEAADEIRCQLIFDQLQVLVSALHRATSIRGSDEVTKLVGVLLDDLAPPLMFTADAAVAKMLQVVDSAVAAMRQASAGKAPGWQFVVCRHAVRAVAIRGALAWGSTPQTREHG